MEAVKFLYLFRCVCGSKWTREKVNKTIEGQEVVPGEAYVIGTKDHPIVTSVCKKCKNGVEGLLIRSSKE